MLNGPVTLTIPLAWILYDSPITPSYYNLYRKKSSDVYFQLLETNIQANTWNDSATQSNTTYDYYVRPVFPSGIEGIKSNIVVATTPSLQYIYTLRSALDIYNVSTPNAPALAVSIANGLGGSNPYDQYADQDYLWINDGESLYTFHWSSNPLNPTLVHSVIPTYPTMPSLGCTYFIIRRGMLDRNNLLILFNPHNGGVGSLESYSIVDPANPVLINSKPIDPMGFFSPRGFAYDSVNHWIINHYCNHYNDSRISIIPVAGDGTLGDSVQISTNLDFLGRDWYLGWMYQGDYYTRTFTGGFVAVKPDGTYHAGKGGVLPGLATWAGVQPRLRGKYLFLGADQADAGYQAVLIWNMDTWTQVAQIGGINHSCMSLVISENLLVFAAGGSLYVYDITATLASGSAPTQLGALVELNSDNGFSAYPTDGWEGNNGGCST
jgi:hypothetical protein